MPSSFGRPETLKLDEPYIRSLIERFKVLYSDHILDDGNLEAVESALGVVLPDDMKLIAAAYDGGEMIGAIPSYSLRSLTDGYGVVSNTLQLRGFYHNLDARYVYLADLDESLMLLETNTRDKSRVVWVDLTEIMAFANGVVCPSVEYFDSFAEYFDKMLSDEEEDRAYEAEVDLDG